MTLRFATLGSGSRGNALLVEFGSTLLMVDCGLPRRDLELRLKAVGRSPADITALLVTHEHADHLRGVAPFARRYGTPVWMTPGTAANVRSIPRINSLSCHRPLMLGDIRIEPYTVPHDAREPCQFVFGAGGRRLGLLTDTGYVTAHIDERLKGCDALALECNHDLESLARGSYPPSVKSRVASNHGHLNNEQAAALLERFRGTGLQWVMAMHISEQNNSAEHVRSALAPAQQAASWPLHLAEQNRASDWISID